MRGQATNVAEVADSTIRHTSSDFYSSRCMSVGDILIYPFDNSVDIDAFFVNGWRIYDPNSIIADDADSTDFFAYVQSGKSAFSSCS